MSAFSGSSLKFSRHPVDLSFDERRAGGSFADGRKKKPKFDWASANNHPQEDFLRLLTVGHLTRQLALWLWLAPPLHQ